MGKRKKPARAITPRKDPHAVALGRKGGLKGGRARANALTPEQLSDAARKAVQARWERVKREDKARSVQA